MDRVAGRGRKRARMAGIGSGSGKPRVAGENRIW